MMLRTREIVDEHYNSWSYVARTQAEDALAACDQLNKYHFNLPVDLAVRQFTHIKDAF
jgi:hypothetical protein